MKKCKDCQQGYTKEGFAAHPDHIELCPLHASADELRCALLVMLYAHDYKDGDRCGIDISGRVLTGNEFKKIANVNARAVLRGIK